LWCPLTKLAFPADCPKAGDNSGLLLSGVFLSEDFYPALIITDTSEQAMPCDLDLSCSVAVFRGEDRIYHMCLFVVVLILSWKCHFGNLLDRMWFLMDLYSDQSNSSLSCMSKKASA